MASIRIKQQAMGYRFRVALTCRQCGHSQPGDGSSRYPLQCLKGGFGTVSHATCNEAVAKTSSTGKVVS